MLFLASSWPKNNIFLGKKYEPLINWKQINLRLPWHIIFLIGGSIALASGAEDSGLSAWFGNFLENVMPRYRIWSLLIVIIFGAIGTEVKF